MKYLKTFLLSMTAALLLAGPQAQASLIPDATVDNRGQGFGAVTNILTFGSTGGAGDSNSVAGGVGWDGSANTFFGVSPAGAVDTNIIKTSTWTFGELTLTAASQIVVIWDPAEQGGAPQTSVDMAVLNIYTAAGALFWSSGSSATSDPSFLGYTFPDVVNPGTGGNGFAFRLDDPQAASLQAALDGVGGGFGDYRIGLYAEHSFLDNGPDTWLIASINESPSVPEPSTLALLGLSLVGFGLLRRRKR